MLKPSNTYKQIESYYHTKFQEISKKVGNDINTISTYEYNFNETDNTVEIQIESKIKLRAEYKVVGVYNMPLSVWYWAWNIAFVNKKMVDTSMRGFKDLDKLNMKEADETYYIMSNDNFYITGDGVTKIIKMVLFTSQGEWIFPIRHANDKIEYIVVTKILQLT